MNHHFAVARGALWAALGVIVLCVGGKPAWGASPPGKDAAGGMPVCLAERDQCRAALMTCDDALGECAGDLSRCEQELADCQAKPAGLLATGADRQVVQGEDGNPAFGLPLSYTDNGLTVIDDNTGLEWEKKTEGEGLNDVSARHPWRGTCNVAGVGNESGAECGTDVDCVVDGETCNADDGSEVTTIFEWVAELNAAGFAGHDDWRIPNVRELQSIFDYGGFPRWLDPVFGPKAAGGLGYWTSTALGDEAAWYVLFFVIGNIDSFTGKRLPLPVRAVRGGAR